MKKGLIILVKAEIFGGAERIVYDISRHFKDKFDPLIIVSSHGKLRKEILSMGIIHFEINPRQIINPLYLIKIFIKLKKTTKKPVHFSIKYLHRQFLPLVFLFKYFTHCKSTIYFAVNIFKDLKGFLVRADYYLALSEAIKENLVHDFKVNENNIAVNSHGIEIKIKEMPYNSKHPNTNLTMGYAGRLEKEKGVKYLIEAVEQIKSNQVKLIIQGEGSEKNNLKNLSEDLGLTNKISFSDWSYNMEDFFLKIDVLVLPSISKEGLGLILLEAMVHKKLVIGTRIGGIKEIIQNNVNGYLVDPNSSDDIAIRINKVIEEGIDRQLIENGYNTARKYSLEKAFSKYEEFYRQRGIL